KSAVYLGAAARASASTVFTVDHHRGSEENQPGWQYHAPSPVEPGVGRIDTLPTFRHTLADAGLEDEVVAVVGRSTTVSAHWRTPLSLLFVDGGHTDEHAGTDYVAGARGGAGGIIVDPGRLPGPRGGGPAAVHDLPEGAAERLQRDQGAGLDAGA